MQLTEDNKKQLEKQFPWLRKWLAGVFIVSVHELRAEHLKMDPGYMQRFGYEGPVLLPVTHLSELFLIDGQGDVMGHVGSTMVQTFWSWVGSVFRWNKRRIFTPQFIPYDFKETVRECITRCNQHEIQLHCKYLLRVEMTCNGKHLTIYRLPKGVPFKELLDHAHWSTSERGQQSLDEVVDQLA